MVDIVKAGANNKDVTSVERERWHFKVGWGKSNDAYSSFLKMNVLYD